MECFMFIILTSKSNIDNINWKFKKAIKVKIPLHNFFLKICGFDGYILQISKTISSYCT